jgi:hypothetical protein
VGFNNTYGAIKTRATTSLGPGTRIDTSGRGRAHSSAAATNMSRLSPIRRARQIPPLPGAIFDTGAQADPNLGKVGLVRSLIKQFVAQTPIYPASRWEEFT